MCMYKNINVYNKNIFLWYWKKGLNELKWVGTFVSLISWESKKKREYKVSLEIKCDDKFLRINLIW